MEEIQIAQVAHEANRAYCDATGDYSQISWENAPEWQRKSAANGVHGILNGSIETPEDAHLSWLREKEADGWVVGAVKDADAKTHPCIVPYHQLPAEQQRKDALFFAVVKALAPVADKAIIWGT